MKFGQASRSTPFFYKKLINGQSVYHATMHTFFVPGENLYVFLQKNIYLPFSEKLYLFKEVAKPLATIFHNKKLAHRDLKPENIIINIAPNNVATYVDLDEITPFNVKTKDRLGTPRYIPLQPKGDINTEYQDIFALSMIGIDILLSGTFQVKIAGTDCDVSLDMAFEIYLNEKNQILVDEILRKTNFVENERLLFQNIVKKETNLIFYELALGQIEKCDAISQAKKLFKDELNKKSTVNNKCLLKVADCLFEKQAQEFTIKLYQYYQNHKSKEYKVSAYTHFALEALDKLALNEKFAQTMPDYLLDTLIRGVLSEPNIAPNAQKLFEFTEKATENALNLSLQSLTEVPSNDQDLSGDNKDIEDSNNLSENATEKEESISVTEVIGKKMPRKTSRFFQPASNSSSEKEKKSKSLSKKKMVALQTSGVAVAASAVALGTLIALWKAAPVIMATGVAVGPAGLLAATLVMGLATVILGGAAIAASCVAATVADKVIENRANSPQLR